MRRSRVPLVVGLALAATAALGWALWGRGQEPRGEPAAAAAPPEDDAGPSLEGLSEAQRKVHGERQAARWRATLAGDDAPAKRRALERWERNGLDPRASADAVVPLLAEVDPEVRRLAREALLAIGAPAVDALLTVGLRSPDWEMPGLAVEALGALARSGHGGAATEALLTMLRDPQAPRTWREHAALALGQLRPVEERVRSALLLAASDPSDEVASAAIEGLGSLGVEAEPALPQLLALLKREDRAELASEIVDALARIPRRPDLVVPALLARLPQLPFSSVQADDAAPALAAAGQGALPYLAAGLEHAEFGTAFLVCHALTAIGPPAASLAEEVVKAMARDHDLLWAGGEVLTAMGPGASGVVASLVALVASAEAEEDDTYPLLWALGALGPKGFTALLGLLDSGGEQTRSHVCRVLADHFAAAPETRARLTALSEHDRDESVRSSAAWGIRILDGR